MQETNFVISDYFVINEEYQDDRLYFKSDIDYSQFKLSDLEILTEYFLIKRKVVNGLNFKYRLASFLWNYSKNDTIYTLSEYKQDKGKVKCFQVVYDHNNNKNEVKCINQLLSIDNNRLDKYQWITFKFTDNTIENFSFFLFSDYKAIKEQYI